MVKLLLLAALVLQGCGAEVGKLFEAPGQGGGATGEAPSNAVLILSLDAALANGGTAPYASGCTPAQFSWKDNSGNNTAATITNFLQAECSGVTADGWQGSGTPADPYRLNFDGVDDYVDVGDITADLSQGLTIEVWARPSSATNWARFFDFGLGQQNENILFARSGVSTNLAFYSHRGAAQTAIFAAGQVQDNVWRHYAATTSPISGTNNANGSIYVDGAEVASGVIQNFVNVVRTSNFIGRSNWPVDAYYHGDIAVVKIYRGARTATEMRTNCHVDASRFGVICN